MHLYKSVLMNTFLRTGIDTLFIDLVEISIKRVCKYPVSMGYIFLYYVYICMYLHQPIFLHYVYMCMQCVRLFVRMCVCFWMSKHFVVIKIKEIKNL